MGHKNTKKHKAMHCGYREKPSKKAINALMDLYAGVSELTLVLATPGKGTPRLGTPVDEAKPGEQLSLF